MFINYQWGALSTLPLQPPKFEKLEKTSKWVYNSLGYINPKFQILQNIVLMQARSLSRFFLASRKISILLLQREWTTK